MNHSRTSGGLFGMRALVLLAMFSWGCGETDARNAEWSVIAPVVLAPNCATASCHSRAAAESGLDFSEPGIAYKSLFSQTAQVFMPATATIPSNCKPARGGMLCSTPRTLVSPCMPDTSRLVNMLRGRGAQRMPPDRPLPIADIELIERWISQGAKKNPSDLLPSCRDAIVPDADPPRVDVGIVDASFDVGGGG
jgi:hypothetical protein